VDATWIPALVSSLRISRLIASLISRTPRSRVTNLTDIASQLSVSCQYTRGFISGESTK